MGTGRKIAAVAAMLFAAFTFAACGGLDTEDLEGKLSDQLTELDPSLGDIEFSCPDEDDPKEGTEITCTATTPDGEEYDVPVRFANDDLDFESDFRDLAQGLAGGGGGQQGG